MKKFVLALLISSPIFAGDLFTNQDCINVYRDAYLDLAQISKDFNSERLNRAEFSTLVIGLSTEVSIHRGACLVVESPSAKDCVSSYKEIYKGLRNNIKLGSVISGNQKKVVHTESMQKVVDTELREKKDESLLGKVSNFLKIKKGTIVEEVKVARNITMIEYLDLKCDQ